MAISPQAAEFHLLVLNGIPITEQLRMEEALLRADQRNWFLLNSGSPPAIVMGISGKPEACIHLPRFSQNPVPVIKRFSGGGTVFVDPDTVFATWICNTEETGVPCCPTQVHKWAEQFYQKALPSLKMRLQENDYVIQGKKFGGNAQYLRRGRWLHHSSLLWDYQETNMDYLEMPQKTPQYRQRRTHADFLCRLREHFADKDLLRQQLIASVQEVFHVTEASLSEVFRIAEKEHRKATHQLLL